MLVIPLPPSFRGTNNLSPESSGLSFTSWEFFTFVLADGFSLEFEWKQISSSLQDFFLNILVVLNNAVVWMVPTRPSNTKLFSSFNNTILTVTKAPITIGMIVTFMFYSFFFQFPCKSRYLSCCSLFSALFCGQPRQENPQCCKFSFLLIILNSRLLAEIRWSICMPKSHRCLCIIL